MSAINVCYYETQWDWSLPKRGKAYCGKTRARKYLTTTIDNATCPTCVERHRLRSAAVEALRGEDPCNPSAEALAACERLNQHMRGQ